MIKNDFIGLVLCGGRSTRMRRDKGLMPSGKTTWAEHQYQKLSDMGIPAYVSINKKQVATYQKIFSSGQLIQDQSFSDINGPLQGILSAHRAFPEKHILCIPCDMPGLSQHFLSELMEKFETKHPDYHLFIPLIDWQIQPLCALYSREGLQYFSSQYEEGKLKNASMIQLIENYPDTLTLVFENTEEREFENYNTPEDLQK